MLNLLLTAVLGKFWYVNCTKHVNESAISFIDKRLANRATVYECNGELMGPSKDETGLSRVASILETSTSPIIMSKLTHRSLVSLGLTLRVQLCLHWPKLTI